MKRNKANCQMSCKFTTDSETILPKRSKHVTNKQKLFKKIDQLTNERTKRSCDIEAKGKDVELGVREKEKEFFRKERANKRKQVEIY